MVVVLETRSVSENKKSGGGSFSDEHVKWQLETQANPLENDISRLEKTANSSGI